MNIPLTLPRPGLRDHLCEVALYLFLAAQFLPWRATGNIGLVLAGLLWLYSVAGDRDVRRDVLREPLVAAILSLLCVVVTVIWAAGNFAVEWDNFYSHQGPGKTLLVALFVSAWRPSAAMLVRLLACVLALLAILNVKQLGFLQTDCVFRLQLDCLFHRQSALSHDAFYQFRNSGAMQLVLVPFLFAALDTVTGSGKRRLLLGGLALNLAILAATGFRGAWLGMAAAAIWSLGWRRALRLAPFVAVIATTVVAVALSQTEPDADNLFTAALRRGASDNCRIEGVWKPALGLIAGAPLIGHGFRPLAFAEAYANLHIPIDCGPIPGAHNMVLQFAFQAGWLGALAYALLVLIAAWRLWRLDRARPGEVPLARAAFAGWLGAYLVLGQTDSVDWPCLAVLLPITMAILASSRIGRASSEPKNPLPDPR